MGRRDAASPPDSARRPGARLLVGLWPLLLAVVLLAPLLVHRGYPLARDLVFVARQPFTDASVGLGGAAPRAVPLDAVVSVATVLLDGAVLARIALLLALVLAGWGMLRLTAPLGTWARLAASGFAVWNPFVVERMALGQWALVTAYAALPWILLAAARYRRTGERGRAGLGRAVVRLGVADTDRRAAGPRHLPEPPGQGGRVGPGGSWSPGWCCSCRGWCRRSWAARARRRTPPGWRCSRPAPTPRVARPWPWSAWAGSGTGSACRRRATRRWRSPRRSFVVLVLVLGLRRWWRVAGDLAPRMAGLGFGGLLLALLLTTSPGQSALRWAIDTVPGFGLLRDGQKFLAPFVVLVGWVLAAARGRAAEAPDPLWHRGRVRRSGSSSCCCRSC